MDSTVLHQISYGLYVIGAQDNGRHVGCIINTMVQITSAGPTVAISLNKGNYTYEVIHRTRRFTASILSSETPSAVIGTFGFSSSRDTDKFAPYTVGSLLDMPVLQENCCGYLACEVLQEVDMDTHVVLFAKVLDTARGIDAPAMTYAYYHKVIRGKAPKTAPTYIAQEDAPKADAAAQKWQCTVCGYTFEGDFDALPDDYICPICKAAKAKFAKL
nr:flavin reductase [bacterium]